jgi:tRNA-dihydrouridine synthase
MPIVDLARRLEDAGVRAITIHCRTAKMGHDGAAEWSWAARARAAVSIPVIVNGDIRSANDAQRALEQTGCAGVMIGRRAIEHPFIFREARARLAHVRRVAGPEPAERVELCREHVTHAIEAYGERRGVKLLRRFYPGYLRSLPEALAWIGELKAANSAREVHDILDACAETTSSDAGQLGSARGA